MSHIPYPHVTYPLSTCHISQYLLGPRSLDPSKPMYRDFQSLMNSQGSMISMDSFPLVSWFPKDLMGWSELAGPQGFH